MIDRSSLSENKIKKGHILSHAQAMVGYATHACMQIICRETTNDDIHTHIYIASISMSDQSKPS